MAMDKELVWVKLLSFVSCLSNVAWGRYQGVYLNSTGQTLTNNGALRAMGLAAKFLATPLWGACADFMGDPVVPLLLSVVLITLLFDFYRWPSVIGAFGPLLLLKVVRSACNGVNTLVDITTLRTIEFKEAAGYGSQRLWTGVAWGLGSMFVGRFIDSFGYNAIFYWTYLFSALVVLLLVFRPASLRKGPAALGAALPTTAGGGGDGGSGGGGSSGGGGTGSAGGGKRQSLTQLLRAYGAMSAGRPAIRRFLLVMMVYGVGMSLVESVVFLQMEREFGSSKTFMGTLTLVGTLSEFPVWHYSKQLIQRYGHARLLQVAHGTMVVRLLCMALLVNKGNHNPGMCFIQLSHGMCFALSWSAAVDFGFKSAPAELKATSQGVISTAYYIVGAGVGSVIWSIVFEFFGAPNAYLMGAATVAFNGVYLLPGAAMMATSTELSNTDKRSDAPLKFCPGVSSSS